MKRNSEMMKRVCARWAGVYVRCLGFPVCVLVLCTFLVMMLVMSLWGWMRSELRIHLSLKDNLGGHSKASEWDKWKEIGSKESIWNSSLLSYLTAFSSQTWQFSVNSLSGIFRSVLLPWMYRGWKQLFMFMQFIILQLSLCGLVALLFNWMANLC